MLPVSLLTLLALLSPEAQAFDGHGSNFVPGQGTLTAPRLIWQPWSAPKGTWSADLAFEYAHAPMLIAYPDANGDLGTPEPYLTRLTLADVGGLYSFNKRIGVAGSLPIYLGSQSLRGSTSGDLEAQGMGTGDIRVWVPIGVLLPSPDGQGVGLSLVPELTLPTGSDDLRGQHLGAGVSVVAGVGLGRVDLNGNLGVRQNRAKQTDPTDPVSILEEDTETRLVTGASVGVLVRDDVAVTTEVLSQIAVQDGTDNKPSPTELAVSVRWKALETSWLTAGAASSLNGAAGAPRFRVWIGGSWGNRPDLIQPDVDPVEVLKAAETPYDLVVSVHDERGRAVRAEVQVTDEQGEVRNAETDRNGDAVLRLEPGVFDVAIASEGLGTQHRTIVLEEDRFSPPEIDAILHDDEGDAALAVQVQDPEDRVIEGARVAIDGQDFGSTGTGGDLRVEGLASGDHDVEASNPDFVRGELEVASAELDPEAMVLVLDRPPGSVEVICRTAEGQIVGDAQVRFIGPDTLPPQEIGPTGRYLTQLDEGSWTVVVSSAEYGIQEREVEIDPLRKVLQRVDVVLTPEVGLAELQLTVLDPDGNPVQGAEVQLDGVSYGTTSNGGTLTLTGLAPGVRTLQLDAERFQDEAPVEIELVEGVRELLVTMDWKPGSLQVITRGQDERPVDALVRFEGADSLGPVPVGPDGEQYFSLPPGEWTVGVSAPELGLQVREVRIEADQTSLIVINAILREEEGKAILVLTLTDQDGNPVEGARVALDGEPVGTTSNGGTLRIEGLAPNASALEVAGTMYQYTTVSPLDLEEGENDVALMLEWLSGTVNVSTLGPDGAPVDALVRAYGPIVLPPVRVGDDGTRVLYLEPGDWTVVASSQLMGIEQEDVAVEAGQASLVEVNFSLADAVPSETSLLLLVQDPDGKPVQGASVRFGETEATTPEGGSLVFDGPATGEAPLSITAPGYVAVDDAVDIVPGDQTRTLTLDWIDQPVTVNVRTDKGETVQASITWTGPEKVAAGSTDADGVYTTTLRPGLWAVNVQAGDELGAGRVEVEIRPGQAPEAIEVVLADKRVQVTETGDVEILEQVFFDTGKATIRPESYALLDEVAATLAFNPQITQLEIQGHTDNVGTDETNQKLSQRRANAVREYLVSKGVKRSLLISEGYGSTCPVESNDTDAGRAANRRVQFIVLEQNGEPVTLDESVCRPD